MGNVTPTFMAPPIFYCHTHRAFFFNFKTILQQNNIIQIHTGVFVGVVFDEGVSGECLGGSKGGEAPLGGGFMGVKPP